MRFGKYVVICMVGTLLAGCNSASSVNEWDLIVAPSVLNEASLKYYWKDKVNLEDGETIRQIWRLDENLYALTSTHRLITIDAAKGMYKWSYPVANRAQTVFAPCHADEVTVPKSTGIAELISPNAKNKTKPFNAVIINTVSYALLINRDTGELVRKLDFKFVANSPGSSDGIHFYVASVKGWCYAVRLSEGLYQWPKSTSDMITARPVVFRDKLYIGSQDGKFYAINPFRGKNRLEWTNLTDAAISADFTVDSRGCFVPSQDYRLYAYDSLLGDELWKVVTEGPLRKPVQVGIQTVFQYAWRDHLYAIDLARGEKRWKMPEGRTVLACAKIDKTPYAMVLTDNRQLLLVHEILGKTEKSFPMTGLDLFVPNAAKPVIYAATTDGKFVCITPESINHITPEMLKD